MENCSFEKIFLLHVDQIPPLKELYLTNLDQLKNIQTDDSQSSTTKNLQILHVENCLDLIKLALFSSSSFDNLTMLKVSKFQMSSTRLFSENAGLRLIGVDLNAP